MRREIFPFINFENPLYFWVGKGWSGGSTSRPARILKFHMVVNIPKRNGNILGANSYQKFAFFELPLQYTGSPELVKSDKLEKQNKQVVVKSISIPLMSSVSSYLFYILPWVG